MALHRNPQVPFETRLRVVSAAGVPLPVELIELRDRAKDFQRISAPTAMRQKLAAAIVADDHTDRDLLLAAALAESTATPRQLAELREYVRLEINREIRRIYAGVATDIYVAVAAKFNARAESLTAAAKAVDVELPADAAIGLDTKLQKLWVSAAEDATALTKLLPAIHSAAVLAEVCDAGADCVLPLTVDTGELHRRRVWDAWETEGREADAERAAKSSTPFSVPRDVTRSRTGRWGALLRLGATIRACPPDSFTPYRRPVPLEERTVDQDGHNVRVTVDPEDPDYQPPAPVRHESPRVRV